MNGISKRIEEGCGFGINVRVVVPDIGHGQYQIFGESARAVDANPFGISAKMAAPGQAVATTTADDMPFATDNFSSMEVGDIGTDCDDFTDKLVAYNQRDWDRAASPVVPSMNVYVCATNSSL